MNHKFLQAVINLSSMVVCLLVCCLLPFFFFFKQFSDFSRQTKCITFLSGQKHLEKYYTVN